MGDEPISLSYEQPQRSPDRLTLQPTDGGAALQFPPPPQWIFWVQIGGLVFWAVSIAYAAPILVRLPFTFLQLLLFPISTIILGLGTMLIAVLQIVQLRRYGRVGKAVALDSRQLSFSEPGMLFGMTQRAWPLAEIHSAKFRSLSSIVPGVQTGELFIRIRGRFWPIRLRYTGKEVPLLGEFGALVTRAIADAKTADRI